MLFNANKEIFVGKRIDGRAENWQMPQGGIDEGELPIEAALRELEEETGTNLATYISESLDWHDYDLPEHLVPKLWNGQYRGQRQKWFLLRFDGGDADFNLQTKHPEFKEWRWALPAELPDLIVPFKRDIYQQVVDEFLPVLLA